MKVPNPTKLGVLTSAQHERARNFDSYLDLNLLILGKPEVSEAKINYLTEGVRPPSA